jgi:hypothetical protein
MERQGRTRENRAFGCAFPPANLRRLRKARLLNLTQRSARLERLFIYSHPHLDRVGFDASCQVEPLRQTAMLV